jgi:hypothetical protein
VARIATPMKVCHFSPVDAGKCKKVFLDAGHAVKSPIRRSGHPQPEAGLIIFLIPQCIHLDSNGNVKAVECKPGMYGVML